MTSASASNTDGKLTIYPDYCHDLSPTLGKWCPLRASDLGMLKDVGVYVDGSFAFLSPISCSFVQKCGI